MLWHFKPRWWLKCNDLKCPVDRQTNGSSISCPIQHKNQHADLCASLCPDTLEEDKCLFHPEEEKKRNETVTDKSQNLWGGNMERTADWHFQSHFSNLPLFTSLILVTSSERCKRMNMMFWNWTFSYLLILYYFVFRWHSLRNIGHLGKIYGKTYVTVVLYCECRTFHYKHAMVISSSQTNHRNKSEQHWWGNHSRKCKKNEKYKKQKPRAKCDIVRWPFNVNDLGGNGHPNVTVKMHAFLHCFLLREETSLEI